MDIMRKYEVLWNRLGDGDSILIGEFAKVSEAVRAYQTELTGRALTRVSDIPEGELELAVKSAWRAAGRFDDCCARLCIYECICDADGDIIDLRDVAQSDVYYLGNC